MRGSVGLGLAFVCHVAVLSAMFAMASLAFAGAGRIAAADTPGDQFHDERSSSPLVTFQPDNLDFGEQVIKRPSKAKSTTVKNSGDAPLILDRVDISGTNPKSFSISADTCSGATVDPGRTCTVTAIFTPTSTGSRSARLRFRTNAPQNNLRVSLKGIGINVFNVPPF